MQFEMDFCSSKIKISLIKKHTQFTREENGNLSEAFINASFGSEEAGRKAENTLIGIGKKWGSMNNSERIDLMGMGQENAQVQEIGGIKATNAEIHKHHSPGMSDVDAAIADMVTQAQEKGITSAMHAQNMRAEYGDNLEDESKIAADLKAKNVAKVQGEVNKARSNIEKMEKLGIGGPQMDAAENKFVEAYDKLQEAKSSKVKTFADVAKTIDQTKIESAVGQAMGIEQNMNKGVNYAENAMYSEESKQQSTKAKLDTQGGVDSAVGIDVTEASQKASQQKGAVEGLQSEAKKIGEEIGKSAAQVMKDTARSLASGKIASDYNTVDRAGGHDDYVKRMAEKGRISMGDTMGAQDQYIEAYNLKQKALAAAGKENHPFDINNPTAAGRKGFDQYVHDVEENKATVKNAVGEAAEILGPVGTAMVGGAVLDRFTGGHGKKSLKNGAGKIIDGVKSRFGDNITNEAKNFSNNNHPNQSGDSFKQQHGNSFKDDMKYYTEEYGKNKEALLKEKKRLGSLGNEKVKLESQGKPTFNVDDKIEESKSKISSYETAMDEADRNIKATKYRGEKNIPKSSIKESHSKMKAAGVFGGLALAADAFATGHYKEALQNVGEFGSRLIDGNVFGNKNGEGGASTMLENLIIGNDARKQAFSQFSGGSYAAGFTTMAKGMTQQAINGVGEIGEMAIAGAKTLYNNKSYSQNRMVNVIPDANFISSPDKTSVYTPSHIKNAFSQPSGFNTMNAMSGGSVFAGANPVHNTFAAETKFNNDIAMRTTMTETNSGIEAIVDQLMEQSEMLGTSGDKPKSDADLFKE
jgi:O6-methylguanine-DNA--protein-cysteine methyltransferase